MSDPTADERLIELELKFTEQAALLSDLSGVLYAQEKRLEQLALRLSRAEGELQALRAEPRGPSAPADDKPPHY